MDWQDIRLSRGQVAWVLAHGDEPPTRLVSRIKHLKALGIPNINRSGGPGNRSSLSLDELLELAVASTLIDRGMKPQQAAEFLQDGRNEIGPQFRRVLDELLPDQLTQPWIFSKGKTIAFFEDEIILGFGVRISKGETLTEIGDLIRFGSDRHRILLRRLAIEVAGLALVAPDMRTGPR